MPTEDTGATDLNGAAALLTGRMNEERETKAPTGDHESETKADESKPETLEQSTDTEESDQKYKVKVDGVEHEVTLSELQKGYMMESNYRNKTTALNKQKEALEAKAAEVDQQLNDARLLIEEEFEALKSSEMQNLKEIDPEAYIAAREKLEKKMERFKKTKEKRELEIKEKQNKINQKESALLFDAFPQWKDNQELMQKDYSDFAEQLKAIGFSENEIHSTSDHRLFIIANQLRELSKLKNADISSKVEKAKPKSMKPGSSGTKSDIESGQRQKAREKLSKTGSIWDAINYLNA